jgi:putative protease
VYSPPALFHAFNSWSLNFINAMGANFFISPLENNRQNLERTLPRQGAGPGRRSLAFITVFAYPALFRIRADLGNAYHFSKFEDSRGERFRLESGRDGSLVFPERPMSLVDKIPFMQEAGFGRFILDFTGAAFKKRDYKDIMEAVRNGSPLPNTVRFNWKDGFFQNEEARVKGKE